jgi:ATP adenylyltransferase
MDLLWTPWRYKYITSANSPSAEPALPNSCVFCSIRDSSSDDTNYVLHRANHNLVVLNIYPYGSGHLLIVPYEHTANLDEATKETTNELMDLAKRCQTVLREVYQPHGFNIGINLGKSAGAGVAAHLHMHILPRWTGDANFMTTLSETRVIPEDLSTTYSKLKDNF